MDVPEQHNLLIFLHRLAHRQDENFITEAFAHLLRQLLAIEPAFGTEYISRLINGTVPIPPISAPSIQIRTQVTGPLGRPDMAISCGDLRIFVEVKVDSGLGDQQLDRYLQDVDDLQSGGTAKLVLLSRYATAIDPVLRDRVITKRWYEISEWLEQSLAPNQLQNPTCRFLVGQFRGFLDYRGMTIERIGPELVAGITAIRHFSAMLERWMTERQRTVKATFGRDWFGCYTPRDGQHYFVGIYHDRPNVLVFETFQMPVAQDAAKSLGIGRVTKGSWNSAESQVGQ